MGFIFVGQDIDEACIKESQNQTQTIDSQSFETRRERDSILVRVLVRAQIGSVSVFFPSILTMILLAIEYLSV